MEKTSESLSEQIISNLVDDLLKEIKKTGDFAGLAGRFRKQGFAADGGSELLIDGILAVIENLGKPIALSKATKS